VLKQNNCLAQKPVSKRNATTKSVVENLDAKYDKADLPSNVRDSCAHLCPSHCDLLLALLLRFKKLFDVMLGNWGWMTTKATSNDNNKDDHNDAGAS
jgi:hypothetical protein